MATGSASLTWRGWEKTGVEEKLARFSTCDDLSNATICVQMTPLESEKRARREQ